MADIYKKLIPSNLYVLLKRIKYSFKMRPILRYNKKRNLYYSIEMHQEKCSCLANLMILTHVLQKGITMPNRRLGFGYDRVRSVIKQSNMIINKWGYNSIELQSALADLNQYKMIHDNADYILPKDIDDGICSLLNYLTLKDENCYSISKEEYFKPYSDFAEFANSRHSIRWYSAESVDINIIKNAIELAQTAPSACNRQATRVKIISSPEAKKLCCSLQNGNRGFGEMADKWLLITTEMSAWSCNYIHAGYIDAGIFIMNLLYALHYNGLVACTLNAHLTPVQSEQLQKKLGYPPTESPVAFIAIGRPTDSFMVPKSRRMDVNDIIQEF